VGLKYFEKSGTINDIPKAKWFFTESEIGFYKNSLLAYRQAGLFKRD